MTENKQNGKSVWKKELGNGLTDERLLKNVRAVHCEGIFLPYAITFSMCNPCSFVVPKPKMIYLYLGRNV